MYLVSESSSEVQLCAVLNATNTKCAVGFPFEISLSLYKKGEAITFQLVRHTPVVCVCVCMCRYVCVCV